MTNAGHSFSAIFAGGRIPLWVKIAYSGFVAIFIPTYLSIYGPLSFLWFCNVAILVTLAAVWTESSLLASMQLMPIVYPHLIFQIDGLLRLIGLQPLRSEERRVGKECRL